MKTVYEAANGVEAHMIVDLLRQEGIAAHILGAHLQGAVGELPATGLVRVVVDEADHARARSIVEQWDAEQPATVTAPARPVNDSVSRGLWMLLLGLAVGLGGAYAYFRAPVSVDGVDHNGDGVLDEKWTYSPVGATTLYEDDRNLDGKVDYVARYDRRGQVEHAEADDDFDGVFETRATFLRGKVDVSEVDTDADGVADLVWRHRHGVVQTAEYLNVANGKPLRVEYFRLGKVQRAEVDTDRDGELDAFRIHDTAGETLSSGPLSARPLHSR